MPTGHRIFSTSRTRPLQTIIRSEPSITPKVLLGTLLGRVLIARLTMMPKRQIQIGETSTQLTRATTRTFLSRSILSKMLSSTSTWATAIPISNPRLLKSTTLVPRPILQIWTSSLLNRLQPIKSNNMLLALSRQPLYQSQLINQNSSHLRWKVLISTNPTRNKSKWTSL